MPRPCVSRFASLFAVLTATALACCTPMMVPAPIANPQSPYYGRFPPPSVPPAPASPAGPPPAAGPQKVALLVPLSGANAELGQAILDAAQLALFEGAGEPLVLVPRDTGGNATGAANAARAAIGEGARLILGPLLASEVEAVKPIARDAHVNVIAFSTVTSLAGGNIYLMGFLPRQEAVRVVSYARERGHTRFAALVPNSPYGHMMADALKDVASRSGGTVAKIEFYDPRAEDLSASVLHLVPGGENGVSATAPTVSSFDALLLPEGGARLRQIARQVRTAVGDSRSVQLLGSGLWDVPDIGTEPALVGGWFAASPPERRLDFETRYSANYGHPPPRLASLGYDAAALAEVLAHGQGAEAFSQQAILSPSGFSGVDGLFRFLPSGLVQRGLAVLEVQPQGPSVISPAPQSFQDLGY